MTTVHHIRGDIQTGKSTMALGFLERLHAQGVPSIYVAPTQAMARVVRDRTVVPCLWLSAVTSGPDSSRRAFVFDDCDRTGAKGVAAVAQAWRTLQNHVGPTQMVLVNWPEDLPLPGA